MNPDYYLFDHDAIESGGSLLVSNKLPYSDINDLDPQNPYYAGSYPITYDYSGYRFFAKIWLQNNWQDMSDPLTVELRKGAWMDEGTLLSTATAYVTNFGPVGTSGRSYLFDFGTIASLVLNNESLVSENRALVPVLRRAGVDVRFVEARDGHNWENWRDRLRSGLSWLFPGPLWMVYE